MKTKQTLIRSILALSTVMGMAAHGQSTVTWTNALGGEIAVAANWDPNGVPSPTVGPDAETGLIYGDEILFDGRTAGPLDLIANAGLVGASGQQWGLRLRVGANQTGAVSFRSPVAVSAGTRINSITVEAGAGPLTFGNTTNANILDLLFGGAGGQPHSLVNESANPVVIHANVRHRLGGGGGHRFTFGGSGDWIVNNYWRNVNNAGTLVTKAGSGTMTWTGTNVADAFSSKVLDGPVDIEGGTLILRSSDLISGQGINHNGTLLKYDAASGEGLLSGTVSGTGTIEVSAGTLTLSGNNTYSGTTRLSGGTLFVNRAENEGISGPLGVGGAISFSGGALGFRANNTFDYSSRFDTTEGQAYSFDTGGQSVTLATGLTSIGGMLTKSGAGTLTLAGENTYSGLTTVNVGKLVFSGTKSGTANITLADGASFGVTDNGLQITPAVLTLGTTAGATLEFNNVTNTVAATLAPGTVAAAGTVLINVNSGSFNTVGAVYPLITWTSGSAPDVVLNTLSGAEGFLSTNGNTIQLTVTGIPVIWTGLGSDVWNLTMANNWQRSGVPLVFANALPTVFNDSSAVTNVTVGASVLPGNVTVSSAKPYAITSAGANNIGGTGGLTKSGLGTLTLSGGANTYTGVTTVGAGTLIVGALANGGVASDLGAAGTNAANLVLNGGSLQYTGAGAASDRLLTVGIGGGTLDASGSGALALTNGGAIGLSGTGPRTFTLTGPQLEDNILGPSIGDGVGGATSLAKSGDGKWVLTGANTYSGSTVVSDGTLQVGAGGEGGSFGTGNIVNNSAIIFNRTGTNLTPGVLSGTGTLTKDGAGTVILANNNTYSGGTTVNAGTLQIGDGGTTGSLFANGGINLVNEGTTVIFNSTGSSAYFGGGLISGLGNVIVRGNGNRVKVVGLSTYTGWTLIEPGATFQPTEGNAGQLTSSVVTNNGVLKFVAQDPRPAYVGNIVGTGALLIGGNNFNAGEILLHGDNTYSGGTFIGSGTLVIGDGANLGSLSGNVTFTNNFDTGDDNLKALRFSRADDIMFSGDIASRFSGAGAQNNRGRVEHAGAGTLTLTGANTYEGGTLVNAGGFLHVGDGGTVGSIGTGPVDLSFGTLVWNRSDDVAFGGVISGAGSLVKRGAGTLTLGATHTYFGQTIVSNGTLVMVSGGVPGDLVLEGGTFVAGGLDTVVPATVAGSLIVNSGTLVAVLNKSLAPSNTVYQASVTAAPGSTLRLVNAGPAVAVGDTFFLFSQPVSGGAGMTVATTGFSVQNNLETDGSVTVTGVQQQEPPTLSASVSNGQLTLSWPAPWAGAVHVQAQTNSITTGLRPDNWFTIPGTGTGTSYTIGIGTSDTVFYRLFVP